MPHKRTTPEIFKRTKELRLNQTEAEAKLWTYLRAHQLAKIGFRRQHAIGPYIVDFCAPRQELIIELDGSQHLDQGIYDAERTKFLEQRGYQVLRFWNDDVLTDIDLVVQVIVEILHETKSS